MDSATNSSSNSSNMLPYITTQCLFCLHISKTSSMSISHMRSEHSFAIPSSTQLLVDEETLLAYLHLVISQYSQCLYCAEEFGGVDAARYHMIAKGHCKIDIEDVDSEFRDFYDFDTDSGEGEESEDSGVDQGGDESNDEGENDDDGSQDQKQEYCDAVAVLMQPDSESLRMPSGKVISHRSARPNRVHKFQQLNSDQDMIPQAVSIPSQPLSTLTIGCSSSISLSTRATKNLTQHNTQLSQLRAADRSALAHLPSSQQRALLLSQSKQMARATKLERNMRARVENKGNKVLMKHFVPDCPGGRTNG